MKRDPTATEALSAAGYTHRAIADGYGAHEIVDASGSVVARLHAREVWAWLREQRKEGA